MHDRGGGDFRDRRFSLRRHALCGVCRFVRCDYSNDDRIRFIDSVFPALFFPVADHLRAEYGERNCLFVADDSDVPFAALPFLLRSHSGYPIPCGAYRLRDWRSN